MGRVIRERVLGTGAPGDGFDAIEAGQVRNQLTEMPTVIAGNFTKRLANYSNNLAAAIADLPDAGAQGGEIQVDGEPLIEDTNTIPDNLHLIGRGMGATRLRLKNTTNWPVLYVNGTSNVLLADMAVTMESGTATQASQVGLQFAGTCSNVHAERLLIDGLRAGVRVRGGSKGAITGLTLRDLVVLNTAITYGVELSDVDDWIAENLRVEGSYDDGLKIGRTTRNGKVIGGHFNNNGQEGIDAYTGGQNLTIIAPTCDGNTGAGIIVKTDGAVSKDTPEDFAPRNLHIISPSCKNNGTSGLGVYKMASSGPSNIEDQTSLAQVIIDGGEYIDNYADGLWSNARNVAINHPLSRRNGRHGIYIAAQAIYNTITNPVSVGNGVNKGLSDPSFTSFGNKAANVWVRGKHVSLRGGTLLGVDSDTVTDETSLAALTPVSSWNVKVQAMADDVYIDPDFEGYHAEGGDGVSIDKVDGVAVRHGRGTRNPMTGGVYGSVGSTYVRTNIDGNQFPWLTRYTKMFGAPNNATVGWVPDGGAPVMATLPTASASLVGCEAMRSSDWTLWKCVQTGASTYVWKDVTP